MLDKFISVLYYSTYMYNVHGTTPKRYFPNRNISSQAYKALIINFNLNVAHKLNSLFVITLSRPGIVFTLRCFQHQFLFYCLYM